MPKKSGINGDRIIHQLGAGYIAIVIMHERGATESKIFPEGTNIDHITLDIAVGLGVLYQNDFMHGDLKPDNTLIFPYSEPDRSVIAGATSVCNSFMVCA